MSTLDIASLLVGTLLPLLVSVINRAHWPSWGKGAVAIVSSVVAGVITAWATDQLHGKGIAEAVGIVLVAAVGTYKALWQPAGIGPRIEVATTPARTTVGGD